jgi:imidazolonepropionase-like amidohydrolase
VKVVYDHAIRRPSIDRPTLEALIAAATERGLKTIVHVGTWDDVRHAVLAGATAVTHVPRQSVVPDDVVTLIAERRTYHIPTLAVQTDLPMLWLWQNKMLIDSPTIAALTTDAIRNVYRKGVPNRPPEDTAASAAVSARSIDSVRRLHAAGIRMLAGTDAGNWGVLHGYSVPPVPIMGETTSRVRLV